MDYDDAVATLASPRPAGPPLPEVLGPGGPARRLRDAGEPLAMHALWNRRTNECLAALGLDFLTGYVWGRAASLGEPSPAGVAAGFCLVAAGPVGRALRNRPDGGAARAAAGGQGRLHRR